MIELESSQIQSSEKGNENRVFRSLEPFRDASTQEVYRIAVLLPIPLLYHYLGPPNLLPGVRVLVPVRNRQQVGVIVDKKSDNPTTVSDFAIKNPSKLKAIGQAIDEQPTLSEAMIQLAQWMARYYVAPIGETFRTMLPAWGIGQKKDVYRPSPYFRLETLQEADFLRLDAPELFRRITEIERISGIADFHLLFKDLFHRKQKTKEIWLWLLEKRFLVKSKEFALRRKKLAPLESLSVIDLPTIKLRRSEPIQVLNEDQNAVVEKIVNGSHSEDKKPFLLFGVTGSGKTEVYLEAIDRIVFSADSTGQALFLVPEIALTPQTLRRIEKRFPKQVAVIHSNMSQSRKMQSIESIFEGTKRILIGPRSAVFCPFKNLKMIVVDEEHDSSYKQQNGLHYHARDIAIKRGSLENASVILGSATPSLESYRNALAGKHELLELKRRATTESLPEVNLVIRQKSDPLICSQVLDELRRNLEAGRQSMVIVNRRGYANFLFNTQDKTSVLCPNCSVSLTYHKKATRLLCHYCDLELSLNKVVNDSNRGQFLALGVGSERVEEFLQKELPSAKISRVDSDSIQQRGSLESILADFAAGKLDILVGTQILAKGHDFPNVTVTVILECDQGLLLPDFRAGEKTFQLIVQASGRSGRGKIPGRVYLQCWRHDHPVINEALAQNFARFAAHELAFRERHFFPPFARTALLELRSQDDDALKAFEKEILLYKFALLKKMSSETGAVLKILGPARPGMEKIRNYFRSQILIFSNQISTRNLAAMSIIDFLEKKKTTKVQVRIDIDPISVV